MSACGSDFLLLDAGGGLTMGVETVTVLRSKRVCTTGPLRPSMAWGREWKSLVRSRWAGKYFSRMS